MFASTEYLLAGLPVVSTPSIGGRESFYDEEYCRIAEPDARSVAEATAALRALGVPPTHIRERTIRRLDGERSRFLTLINTILEESASSVRLAAPWPFRKAVTMEWMPADEALRRATGVVDAFTKERRGLFGWRRWRRRFQQRLPNSPAQ